MILSTALLLALTGSLAQASGPMRKCKGDADLFDASHGGCWTYAQNHESGNYPFCTMDKVLYTWQGDNVGLFASEVCPQCGQCGLPDCEGDASTAEFKYGACNSYASDLVGEVIDNHNYCLSDKEVGGSFLASQVCPQCGRCAITECMDETFTGDGADYRGCQTVTRSGFTCKSWTDNSSPNVPSSGNRDKAQKGENGLGNHNHCRNPDGEATIWCYTTSDKKRWDYCDPQTNMKSCKYPPALYDVKGYTPGADVRGCAPGSPHTHCHLPWGIHCNPETHRGTPKITKCGSQGGDITFSGCEPMPCKFPPGMHAYTGYEPGAFYEGCMSTGSDTCPPPAGFDCADGHTGTPVISKCKKPGGGLTFSGCVPTRRRSLSLKRMMEKVSS